MSKKFIDLANLKSNLENFLSEIISPTFATKEGVSKQLGEHTVKSDVPENAVFTDTVYDDTEVQKRISDNGYREVAGGKNLLNHNIIDSKIKNCAILFKNDTFYATNKGNYSLFTLSVPTIVGKSYTLTIKDWSDYSYRCIASVSDLSDNTLVSMVITDATLSMTFTAVGTESLIHISPNNTPNEMSNTITFKCMLEEGSVATEYEPYFPSNKMLAEENSQQSTEMMDIKREQTINMLSIEQETLTSNGITCRKGADGICYLSGTATADTTFKLWSSFFDGIDYSYRKYKVVGAPKGASESTFCLRLINEDAANTIIGSDYGKGFTFTPYKDIIPPEPEPGLPPEDMGPSYVSIFIKSGQTPNHVEFRPMLTTNLDATYNDFVSYTGDTGKLNSDIANIIKLQNTLGGKVDSSIYSSDSINLGRKTGTEVGKNSFAFGNNVEASGSYSHAEGYYTSALGKNSHAEGNGTTASGDQSHAEGNSTAEGNSSHAEGCYATASGAYSHAEGYGTTASGNYSHAEGVRTTALINQHAQGHCNNTTTATENSFNGTSSGTAFVIGNGTSSSAFNAFRVTGEGKIYATNASVNTGADYAEYFEWSDGNPNNEDRVGYFVTFDNNNPEKIKLANSSDDYILGIVSGMPSIIGNGDEDWKKRYILDDFGRYIKEEFEYEIEEPTGELDEEGNIIFNTVKKTGTKWKENPDYDNTKEYTPRDQRQEWSAVGMLGVLSVYDDGTCEVNGFCKISDGGIATKSEDKNDYRVISRLKDNIVRVVFR